MQYDLLEKYITVTDKVMLKVSCERLREAANCEA
jgi:hypothetical protein